MLVGGDSSSYKVHGMCPNNSTHTTTNHKGKKNKNLSQISAKCIQIEIFLNAYFIPN